MVESRRLTPAAIRLMPFLALITALLATTKLAAADESAKSPKAAKPYVTESLTGKVVWLADALKERFGVKSDDDVAHAVVALETPAAQLHPSSKTPGDGRFITMSDFATSASSCLCGATKAHQWCR